MAYCHQKSEKRQADRGGNPCQPAQVKHPPVQRKISSSHHSTNIHFFGNYCNSEARIVILNPPGYGGIFWFDVAKISMFCLTAAGKRLHFDELIVITDEQSEKIRQQLALLCNYWYRNVSQPTIRLVHWTSVLSDEGEEEDEA